VITLFAFLHHLAAFGLVAALSTELVLLNGEMGAATIRRLARADRMVGILAIVALLVGLARVFHFGKGAAYYFRSAPFIAKLSLFFLIAMLSIYPTIQFVSWARAQARGHPPGIEAGMLRRLRMLVHVELTGIMLILLCAAMMARGVGSFS